MTPVSGGGRRAEVLRGRPAASSIPAAWAGRPARTLAPEAAEREAAEEAEAGRLETLAPGEAARPAALPTAVLAMQS